MRAYEEGLRAAEETRASQKTPDTVTRDRAVSLASRFERGEVEHPDEDAETARRREEDAALFREAGEALRSGVAGLEKPGGRGRGAPRAKQMSIPGGPGGADA